jgi:hypothetical protein
LFRLVLESHDGRALVPIPERSTSPRATSNSVVVDSLKALDPNRPIREADMAGAYYWSGRRESNPCMKLGKLPFYH